MQPSTPIYPNPHMQTLIIDFIFKWNPPDPGSKSLKSPDINTSKEPILAKSPNDINSEEVSSIKLEFVPQIEELAPD